MTAVQTERAERAAGARPGGAAWPLPDAARFLGVSERHVARLISAGSIQSFKIGRRRLIPDAEVKRVATEGAK